MKRLQPGSAPGPDARRIAAGACFAFANLGMTVAVLGPAVPFLAEATGSSLGAIAYLFAAQNLGYLLGSFIGGRLHDRLPAAKLMAWAFFAMLPVFVLLPLSRSLAVLLPLATGLGVLQGGIDVGGNLLILRTPAEGRGVRMNALHAFFGAGAFLAPLAMAQAVRLSGNIVWGFCFLALFLLAAWFWMLRLPGPRRVEAASGTGAGRPQPLLVALVAAFVFLTVGAEAGYGAWIYTYALRRGLADAVAANYLTSVFWGCLAAGRLAATLLALRLRPRFLILFSLAGCLAAAAAVLARPAEAVVWAGTAAFGFFVGPLVANIFALAGQLMPVTGKVAGVFVVGISLGGLAIPWAIGQLIEPAGPAALPGVLAAAIILAGLSFAGFLLRAKAAGSR